MIMWHFADEYTEESLEQHDREVTVVRQYYQDNREMLERVARRQALWADFMEFEVRGASSNRKGVPLYISKFLVVKSTTSHPRVHLMQNK